MSRFALQIVFENAIKHCSGTFIALSDQDDLWMPKKIENQRSSAP